METYGLIGKVLGHSYSYRMFNQKFQLEGIDAEYLNFEMSDVSCVKALIAQCATLRGFNVTIPYKTAIIPLLDALSDEARSIGAVNVVCVGKYGFLTGYNTDITGFIESIRPHLLPHHRHALVLGSGGVSKAVTYGLHQLNIQSQIVSRTQKKGAITYAELTEDLVNDAIIVNCTPIGMFPKTDECPDIPYHLLSKSNLLFDCVANPDETLFMQRGRNRGATTIGGGEMLRIQADAAWHIWQKNV